MERRLNASTPLYYKPTFPKQKISICPYTLKRTVFLIKQKLLSSKNIHQTIALIELIDTRLVKVIGFKLPEVFIMFYLIILSLLRLYCYKYYY